MPRIVECWRCDGTGFNSLYECTFCGGCGTLVEEDKEPDDNLDDYIEEENND